MAHEWTLAAVFSVLLSVGMTWPTMRDPLHTLPNDIWDPSLQSWEMAWAGWAIKNDPGQLWHSNAFYSEMYAFAYSDTLLGYLPAALIGSGLEAAILRYNVMFVLVFALAFFGAYMLARQLGSRMAGAALAGAAFAYAPWRWAQVSHLHVLSTGGMALSLAMLARGHGYSLRHGHRPERARPGWALAGWLVAAWQITIGFGVGLPFGYVLGLLTLISLGWWLVRRPRFDGRLLRADVIGCVVFVAVTAFMAHPYLKVVDIYPYASRSPDEILSYSPALEGFFTAPASSWLWGKAHQSARENLAGLGGGEAYLLSGFVLYAFAAVGLFYSVWTWRHRVLLALSLVCVGSLAMGLRAPITFLYRLLHGLLPGWDAIRTPGRLVVWTTLILAVLAAGALSALGEQAGAWIRHRSRAAAQALLALGTALSVTLVLAEGIQQVQFPAVPRPPAALAAVDGPLLVLPTNWLDDEVIMLWSTTNFVKLVNGASGFSPRDLDHTREVVKSFPDASSVDYLRGLGVRTVMVLRNPPAASQLRHPPSDAKVPEHALTASVDGLNITREERPEVVVFHLDSR